MILSKVPSVERWDSDDNTADVASLLTAYHLQTESEKSNCLASTADLPQRYLAEITHPATTFADDAVLVAHYDSQAVAVVVVANRQNSGAELKRLWVSPSCRGRGIAALLINAAIDFAVDSRARYLRLSVWKWRQAAINLYLRHGFNVVAPWDERPDLICMERILADA